MNKKITYLSGSSISGNKHSTTFDMDKIANSNLLIVTNGSTQKTLSFDFALNDFCNQVGLTVSSGGNVLIPCLATALVFDLFEVLNTYLSSMNMTNVPIYFISPAAESLLAYSDIISEWLNKAKQEKVYLPEPPFYHNELIKNGRIRQFPSIVDSKFSSFQEPCIVLTGHPSLRCGDVMHLIQTWKKSDRNAIVFIDPHYDWLKALSPFEPINMKIYNCPLDSRLTSTEIHTVITKSGAERVLIADTIATDAIPKLAGTKITSFQHLDVVSVDLHRKTQECFISQELASKIKAINIGQQTIAPVYGVLSQKDGKMTLEAPKYSSASGSEVQRKRILWGSPKVEEFVRKLGEAGYGKDITRVKNNSGTEVVDVPDLKNARITFSAFETSVYVDDQKIRKELSKMIVELCYH
jgi:integrator complex subunit 9